MALFLRGRMSNTSSATASTNNALRGRMMNTSSAPVSTNDGSSVNGRTDERTETVAGSINNVKHPQTRPQMR